jgi:hypothetical protein
MSESSCFEDLKNQIDKWSYIIYSKKYILANESQLIDKYTFLNLVIKILLFISKIVKNIFKYSLKF